MLLRVLRSSFGFAFWVAFAAAATAQGTWQPLAHQPPWAPSTMFLLTDGSILTQRDDPNGNIWAKLVPDINGSYVNGTWVTVASSHYTRLYYGSGVLADGRVIVSGGEYSNAGSETTKTEVYDPVANTWTEISAPPGWTQVGDAPSAVLADGRFFLGSISSKNCAFWDPVTGIWTAGPLKNDTQCTEESWTLMPDNSVLCIECRSHPATERWVPSTNTWVTAGNTLQNLVLPSSLELGAALTLPDGRGFVIGGTPHTGLYTMPGTPTGTGTWANGPDFPTINTRMIGAEDAPAAVLPNGHVMITGGPVTANGGTYETPTYFFEWAGTGTVLPQVTAPPNSTGQPFIGRMMITPTGQLLFAAQGQIQVFTPSTGANPAWKPSVTYVASVLAPGGTYILQGRQLNGLTQAVAYGDEAGVATNYPIIRIRNNATGHVFYCRTFGHSTMAIATGSAVVSTNFKLPASIEPGPSQLTVVANGIPSDPMRVRILARRAP